MGLYNFLGSVWHRLGEMRWSSPFFLQLFIFWTVHSFCDTAVIELYMRAEMRWSRLWLELSFLFTAFNLFEHVASLTLR